MLKETASKNFNFFSFLLLSAMSVSFGLWFAQNQMAAVAEDALLSYPKPYFLLTVTKVFLCIFSIFALNRIVLSKASLGKVSTWHLVISFIPLSLVWLNVSILNIVALIALLQLTFLFLSLKKGDYQSLTSRYLTDVGAFFFLLMCHFFLTTTFSPLHWHMALLTVKGQYSEGIAILAPLFKSFILAKQFSFSSLDHAAWAGIMHPPVALTSPFMQLIEFIFDVPSVSYEWFHILISAIYFTLVVLGSFGFYLFLKYAVKLKLIFCLLGGFLLFFSGAPFFKEMLNFDGGIFLSAVAMFPYALLFASLAFSKNNMLYAMWAGLALAAQFFFMAPHPEGTIYSTVFYSVYLLGLFLFTRELNWTRKFLLAACSMFVFFSLSAFSIAPMLYDKITGNMIVLAHTSDIETTSYDYFARYVNLLILFVPISFFLLRLYKRITAVYLSSLLLTLPLLGCVIVVTHIRLITAIINFTHLGLHLWVQSRMGIYFYISVLIISLIGINILTEAIFDYICELKPEALRG